MDAPMSVRCDIPAAAVADLATDGATDDAADDHRRRGTAVGSARGILGADFIPAFSTGRFDADPSQDGFDREHAGIVDLAAHRPAVLTVDMTTVVRPRRRGSDGRNAPREARYTQGDQAGLGEARKLVVHGACPRSPRDPFP